MHRTYNVCTAKARFSHICDEVMSSGTEVTIVRHGKPIVRIVPCGPSREFVFGTASGLFAVPEDFDDPCPEIEGLFGA